MNLTKIPRPLLRQILLFLTHRAIKKHKPLIVAIIGEKNASLVRELTYTICKTQYNTRRNLEKTDVEFGIPLTVLGELYYPQQKFGWIKLVIINFLRLIYLKPYRHALVIQIHKITKPIQDTWLKALSPEITISTDAKYPTKNLLTLNDFESIQKGHITENMKMFLTRMSINERKAKIALEESTFLQSRINIFSGKKGSLIVDARHYYYPMNFKAITETIKYLSGRKFLITDIKSDLKALPTDYVVIKDIRNIHIHKNAIYIFRGSKKLYINEIRNLSREEL